MMGSDDKNFPSENPLIQQCINKPFWFGKNEVTVIQYSGFVDNYYGATRPAFYVSWFDAVSFCSNHGMRLPTEVEWEFAARGPDSFIYPWGNTFDQAMLVTSGPPWQTSSKPNGSWVGALDMSGSAAEWVSSIFAPYPYTSANDHENIDDQSSLRVVRGGSYNSNEDTLRTTSRGRLPPSASNLDLGFRCAMDF